MPDDLVVHNNGATTTCTKRPRKQHHLSGYLSGPFFPLRPHLLDFFLGLLQFDSGPKKFFRQPGLLSLQACRGLVPEVGASLVVAPQPPKVVHSLAHLGQSL